MVVIRKPVKRSENLVDLRDITRRGYESVELHAMVMKRKHEMIKRLQEENRRRLRQQQTRGR